MTKDSSAISFPALPDRLPAVMSYVEDRAVSAGISPAKRSGLCLAVEEAFVNICTHAYKDRGGDVELVSFVTSGAFVLEIMDTGPEFNILSVPKPDTSVELEKRELGGLGVHLIRHFTDQADWRRQNNKNILRLTMYLGDNGRHQKET